MAKSKENKEDGQITKVKVLDFLNQKGLASERHIGFLTFLKVKASTKIDSDYLDAEFKKYNSVKGGGL
jgi:hypothetical protein